MNIITDYEHVIDCFIIHEADGRGYGFYGQGSGNGSGSGSGDYNGCGGDWTDNEH